MWNFINVPSYYGLSSNIGDKTILGVGYDNFAVTKPQRSFRVQTFYTWHFIISGSGTLEVEEMKFELSSGDMFFIPPNVKIGKNTAIAGMTTPEDYPDGLLDSGEYIVKAGGK